MQPEKTRNDITNDHKLLVLILLFGMALRMLLVLITDGYSSDVACFSAWAFRMADLGPAGFYAPDYFADYPPAYMLVLGGLGKLAQLMGLDYGTKALELLLSSVPILCDLGSVMLIWSIAVRYAGRRTAVFFAVFAAFSPAFLYDTAVWKQVDSVLCFLLLACFWLLQQKRWLWGAAVYGLALAVKPQTLMFGPVLAMCFASSLWEKRDAKRVVKIVLGTILSALISVGVVFLCALPFGANQSSGWLLEKYTGTLGSYPYASLNGFNLITLLGGNWKPQTEAVFGSITWQQLGTAGVIAATVLVFWLALRGLEHGRFCPFLLCAVYGMAIYTLGHRMHERYMLPALLFILAASARWNDRRLLGSFWLLSLSSLINQAIVLSSNGTDDQFLTAESSKAIILIVSLMTITGFAILLSSAFILTGGGEQRKLSRSVYAAPLKQPRWTRAEGIFLAALTLITAVYSMYDLGDTAAPQQPLDAVGTTAEQEFVLEERAESLRLYTGVTWHGSAVITDEQGNEAAYLSITTQDGFKWKEVAATGLEPGRYTLKLENAQLMEAAFFRADGSLAAVSGGGALLDEQDLVPAEFSYRNSTYFDEIYHGRTAYEHLHGMSVYETTHPPLGKVFIMLGVALFGMTGFGWRISGVLFGVAMVPVMYLFVRRMTRSKTAAGTAAALIALDGMRLAQSRISTIDVYGTFFILLSAYFMIWYCQSVMEKGVCGSILPMVLAGVSFGLGAASKWTGLYAGAGLAILYFGVLWQRYKEQKTDFRKELTAALAGGVLFFVVVPLVIYIAAYFPYWWREGGFSLPEWWQCQLSMFNYHKDLKSTHPYESRWYTWPFALRPVWYYLGSGLPEGLRSSISGMGNPIVWWSGAAAMGWVFWRQFSGRASCQGGALTVVYLTQLLPWVLVSRSTFMYHYFPSLVFAVAAVGLLISHVERKNRKAAITVSAVLIAVSAAVFVCFYPAFTGMTVNADWLEGLRWIKSWVF